MKVFVSGGTGYLGRPLLESLAARGHQVTALARAESVPRVPAGIAVVAGNALDAATFSGAVPGCGTFVHLVGVAHPSPRKAAQFRAIDQQSFRASLAAARAGGCEHFVYLSVARPAPVMRVYQQVRAECEAELLASGLRSTILRPWYVLGPGHRWPYLLIPFYALARSVPSWAEPAERLGLVTRKQMVDALLWSVETPGEAHRALNVSDIRAASPASATAPPPRPPAP